MTTDVEVSVEATLAQYGAITAEATQAYLPAGEPRAYLYDVLMDYPSRPGKAIRPALCLATCVAFGGEAEEALPSAVAIELLHNAFLVHDDIEDGSLLRRGRPTLHTEHGLPLALNAGDALAVVAQAPLRHNRQRLGQRMAGRVAEEFDVMLRRTLEGQATELGWRRDNVVDLTPDDYLDLVLHKTCWYTTIHPMRVGALIGSWGRADLERLVRFGFFLGAAFQIADDLLNLTGDEAAYGKEWRGDLYEGKRTLMLVHLLDAVSPGDRRWLESFLALDRSQRTENDVDRVHGLMTDHGSIDFARHFGDGIAAAAEGLFDNAFGGLPDTEERRFIHQLVGWMLNRRA
jgi:geranylgeranyl diphosphate synthase type II